MQVYLCFKGVKSTIICESFHDPNIEVFRDIATFSSCIFSPRAPVSKNGVSIGVD